MNLSIHLSGNGHAEAAVSKQKDANVETPTSEPGFYIGDFDECENGMEVSHECCCRCHCCGYDILIN